jgi:hypothetical protein
MDEMEAAGVAPDSFSYSTLFNAYLRHGAAEEVLALYEARLRLSPALVNNYVATALLRALAGAGSEADITAFWDLYSNRLQRKDIQILADLSTKPHNSKCPTWRVLRELLSTYQSSHSSGASLFLQDGETAK